MSPEETARATARVVVNLTARPMMSPDTFTRGAELGFGGIDFYFAGRAGVLGEVDAEVVAAALVFFHPTIVHEAWEHSRDVMPRLLAAQEFAQCLSQWADANLPDTIDDPGLERLAELAALVVESANPAGIPLFAAWRAANPAKRATTPRQAAVQQLNLLRELRGGLHGLAVLAAGLEPGEAVQIRTPDMAPVFGWSEADPSGRDRELWEDAEARTNRLMGRAFEVLTDGERDELGDLLEAVYVR